ncbi:hypothetical protein [Halapricum desulfuricans]|nr:hypothetical protein [Halapricum desulfuricans]
MADTQTPDNADDERPSVSAHSPTEERTVFTEDGNADAWIATDTTVEPPR